MGLLVFFGIFWIVWLRLGSYVTKNIDFDNFNNFLPAAQRLGLIVVWFIGDGTFGHFVLE